MEGIIEANKDNYYLALRRTQQTEVFLCGEKQKEHRTLTRVGLCGAPGFGSASRSAEDRSPAAAGRPD